jgi:hypothetical protein
MKIVQMIRFSFLLLIAFYGQLSLAQAFDVIEGKVVVTPAFCAQNPCPSTSAALSGSFKANISSTGSILFPSSNLITAPDVDFQLPTDPNEDSNGTTREIAFTLDGDTIKAKGYVDSRAFDGPLVEYYFVAKQTAGEFFTARPDYRKCAAPLCGGYFVKSVNKKLTQCANGTLQNECYVSNITYGGGTVNYKGSVGNTTPLLLIGRIEQRFSIDFISAGVFVAKAAFRSATDKTATQKFYGVTNNGIVCITTPCFSYDQTLLNSTNRITNLSEVNLEMSGAKPDDIEAAQLLLANGDALYGAGVNQKYRDFAGIGVRFVAQQFYLPIKPVIIPLKK